MKTLPKGDPALTPDDLIVTLNPDFSFAEFEGPRALLEADGLIPEGTDWPQGYENLHWQAGKFDYWLRRCRPPGAKGPRRDFGTVDWFWLRQTLTNGPSFEALKICRKQQELAEAIYRASANGAAKWSAQWNRYCAAKNDAQFQSFKATIPGLVAEKRGRPRKNSGQEQRDAT